VLKVLEVLENQEKLEYGIGKVVNVLDLGYLGIETDFPEQLSALPCKKKINHEDLSKEEKEYNKNHSKKKE
jgi:hypothetical protein